MAFYDSKASTSKKRVNRIYSDLDLDFTRNPVTGDVVKLVDVDAVKRSVKNLIQTNHYERPFHPEIGCKIKKSLFENIMPSTALTLQNSIEEVVDNFEPRIDLTSVTVVAQPDENAYHVTITFFIVNEPVSRQVTFFLERIR